MLTRTGAPRLVCAKEMGVARRSAGLFGAVRVVAVQTCALIVNGARDVFLVLSAKVKKKNIISRRHSARTGARALLRTDRWKLYDVQDGDVVHTPPYNFNSVRVWTTPPWRDVHRGVVARFFYHFQSRFLW